jgi:exosome complex RNA-binding protein Rrp42 (RNase PH superfamily)
MNKIHCSILKMDELVILKGEEEEEEGMNIVWFLYVDIYCLNYDGNVFDSALLALVAALKNGNTTSTMNCTLNRLCSKDTSE